MMLFEHGPLAWNGVLSRDGVLAGLCGRVLANTVQKAGPPLPEIAQEVADVGREPGRVTAGVA